MLERRRYRNHKVWVHVDTEGAPVCDERGLASIRYGPRDDRAYTVRPEQIGPIPAGDRGSDAPDGIHVWVRTATAQGVGAAAILAWRGRERALELYFEDVGESEARLETVRAALRVIRRPDEPVHVYVRGTDGPEWPRLATTEHRFTALRITEAAGEPDGESDCLAERLARRAAAVDEGESSAPGVGSA